MEPAVLQHSHSQLQQPTCTTHARHLHNFEEVSCTEFETERKDDRVNAKIQYQLIW